MTISLLIVLAFGITGLLGWELLSRRIDQLRRTAPLVTSGKPAENSGYAAAAISDPKAEMQNKLQVAAAAQDVEPLLHTLLTSSSIDDRLKAVADGENHRHEVNTFFPSAGEPPVLLAVRAISNPPRHLSTGELLPVFRVSTTRNRSGSLVWIVTNADGKPAIHWPLFFETHEGALASFIEAKSAAPRWFYVGLRRAHSFDLPESERANYHAVDIDGSTDGSAHIVAYVARESPIGRLIDRRLEWGKFYLGRLLLSWMDIAGEERLVILDSEESASISGR